MNINPPEDLEALRRSLAKMQVQVSLRLSKGLLARVDEARGDVPRERWLRRVVEQALGGEPAGVVPRVRVPPAPAESTRKASSREKPGRSPVSKHSPTCRCGVCA